MASHRLNYPRAMAVLGVCILMASLLLMGDDALASLAFILSVVGAAVGVLAAVIALTWCMSNIHYYYIAGAPLHNAPRGVIGARVVSLHPNSKTISISEYATDRQLSCAAYQPSPNHDDVAYPVPLFDSVIIASPHDTAHVLDLHTHTLTPFYKGASGPLAVSPNGKYMALTSLSGKNVRVCGIPQLTCINHIAIDAHLSTVTTVLFSPQSSMLATGHSDGHVCVYATHAPILLHHIMPHMSRIDQVLFIHDCILSIAADDDEVKVWDLKASAWLATIHTDRQFPRIVSLSYDSHCLVIACGSCVRRYQTMGFKLQWEKESQDSITTLASVVNESFLATHGNARAIEMASDSWKPIRTLRSCQSPAYMVVHPRPIRLWHRVLRRMLTP